jgi:hypothetical protein
MPPNRLLSNLFQDANRVPQFRFKHLGCHGLDETVGIAVRPHFVSFADDPAHQVWESFGDSAQYKERRPDVIFGQDIQNTVRIDDDPL